MGKRKIEVVISNITEKQAGEFISMFSWMNNLGARGSSRTAKVWYDGDGNARARITVNGEAVEYFQGDIDDASFGFE